MTDEELPKNLLESIKDILEANFDCRCVRPTPQGFETYDIVDEVAHSIYDLFLNDTQPEGKMIDDGLGTVTPAVCPKCGCKSMYVCRPGDIRCGVCYDGNPKEMYMNDLREQIAEILRKEMSVRVVDTIHGKEKEYFFPRGVDKILALTEADKQKAVEQARKQERKDN